MFGFTNKRRPALAWKVMAALNAVLGIVLVLFIAWDIHSIWNMQVQEKKVSLTEESKILLASILELNNEGKNIQAFIDAACGSMQESASPGHHIAARLGPVVYQAHAHHRASPAIFSAMEQAAASGTGLALLDDENIVVGSAASSNVTVYVSEYLSNIRGVIISQIFLRVIRVLVLGGVLAVVLNIVLYKSIAGPLKGMLAVVNRFGTGRLDVRMPEVRTRELGLLADEFNQMASQIQSIDSERRRNMEKARIIQQNLLPSPKATEGIQFSRLFVPASEVAGDYYDVIQLPDRRLLFCVADVIGHDVPAAMTAAMLKAMLKNAAQVHGDPRDIIHHVHATFSEVTIESDFATMIIVCLDMAGKTLTCTSAGHEVCYLVRGDRLIERLDPTGPILGIRGLSEWSQQTLSFEHGDRLILLTDGVTETMSPDEQMYGSDRLVGLISANAAMPLEALFELVVQDINSFRGGNRQTDDITIVAVDL